MADRDIALAVHRTGAPTIPSRLIVAATGFEAGAWGTPYGNERVVVAGVGIPASLDALSEVDTGGVAEIWNIGIAGAYPDAGPSIGDIVVATAEVFGDIGFELPESPHFRFIGDSEFGVFYADTIPCVVPADLPAHGSDWRLFEGVGVTVNACTGSDSVGEFRRDRFGGMFESMEGAAVAQFARRRGCAFIEVRAISNVAARRDMRPQNIRRAILSLSDFFARVRQNDGNG